MPVQQTTATRFEVFYARYVTACQGLCNAPLIRLELLPLIACLLERDGSTLN